MSKQTINIGASPNDGTGTPLRTSFDYTNQNFTELYNALGGGVGLPGSANQIIFNNGSSLAGDADLFWNSTLNFLTVTGSAIITADLTVDGGTLKVDSTNNFVGINKTPVVALDVSGSAAITGDLTVDTSTLKVDSTNNRVGIGTATPADTLDVNGRVTALRYLSSSSNASLPSFAVSAGNGAYSSGANEIGFSINSTNTMTLNSTGLGMGVSPSSLLHVQKSQNADTTLIVNNTNSGAAAVNQRCWPPIN